MIEQGRVRVKYENARCNRGLCSNFGCGEQKSERGSSICVCKKSFLSYDVLVDRGESEKSRTVRTDDENNTKVMAMSEILSSKMQLT